MALREQVSADLANAMRARDEERLSTLRMLTAAVKNLEVARTDSKHPQHGRPIEEGDVLGVIEKEIKQRQDSIEAFEKGNRKDLADKERREIEILHAYLPAHLSRDEIAAHVRGILAEAGSDFKTVMPRAARELKGRADGRLVNDVVRELTGA